MAEEEYLYLTTTGHKSGRSHVIEIWFVSHAGCYYLISERREGSHWVQNIQANPTITFRVGQDVYNGVGRVVLPQDEPELAHAVCEKMDEKYGWSVGLIVELKPQG